MKVINKDQQDAIVNRMLSLGAIHLLADIQMLKDLSNILETHLFNQILDTSDLRATIGSACDLSDTNDEELLELVGVATGKAYDIRKITLIEGARERIEQFESAANDKVRSLEKTSDDDRAKALDVLCADAESAREKIDAGDLSCLLDTDISSPFAAITSDICGVLIPADAAALRRHLVAAFAAVLLEGVEDPANG